LIACLKNQEFWSKHIEQPFLARNKIIASVCPQLHGLFLVKLAILLTVVGGVQRQEAGTKIRGDCHMLLIGDPGIGEM
jgi:DNA helicase MCM9